MTKQLKYYIWALGCAMNKADGERIATVLDSADYIQVDSENKADFIMVVACSVRQSGIDRILGKFNVWKKKGIKTIITGCVLDLDRPKMEKLFDLVFDIKDLEKLPNLIKNL